MMEFVCKRIGIWSFFAFEVVVTFGISGAVYLVMYQTTKRNQEKQNQIHPESARSRKKKVCMKKETQKNECFLTAKIIAYVVSAVFSLIFIVFTTDPATGYPLTFTFILSVLEAITSHKALKESLES